MQLHTLCLFSLASSPVIAQATSSDNSTWPNSFPKQIVANRRRTGLTTAEYLYHHTIVHGRKAWNAPDSIDQPIAYVQDHAFDSAYGINTTAQGINTPQVSYFGHSDVTELYSRSQEAFFTPPPNNYTQDVIGPDGNAFSDFSASISMYAYEDFQAVNSSCVITESSELFNAFYFVFANAENANQFSFDNATFAAAIMQTLLASLPYGSIYNASIHTSVPGLDARLYYGGMDNPTLSAVLKFWLCDDNLAVSSFRIAQLGLISQNDELGINLDESFVMFTRATLIYDRASAIPFDDERAKQALLNDRFRGDLAGPPVLA
ncbi:hypothetical protein PFICI_09220 [Pestalotiopsis fici W106-1]|uniref:EthD domain-containing protein n=1 Tax=Pestalotiopsis fici (strain W106-1 / CGMCC3.15140) TaxID=1229662 RepID=W3X1W9_PESFW|nr:uncharacterized protein PFICI_09220 [Pestalotiopsis fici W106-1]ETS79367.1 hypothetical protein PFICI_09220 [Pestalotiopsis fici W106-1]